ncbi:MAG: MBL fold metallo-hydrolase [Nitrososphaeria archaeon]
MTEPTNPNNFKYKTIKIIMQISFLGSCQEVGRSAFLLETDSKKRILLDYGVKLNSEITLPLPIHGFIDCAIISHAHLDHSGALPLLYSYTEFPTFMTPPSLPLIDLLVKDSIKVSELKGLEPIFTPSHVKRMKRNVILLPYSKGKEHADTYIELNDAGHILGAASVYLENKYGILYTGDIKFEKTRLHNAAFSDFDDVDILITESTYGGREHPPRETSEKEFFDACTEVCENGGAVLVPSFAVGRAQEIACILTKKNFKYPIYIDGMAKQASEIFLEFPNYVRDYNELYYTMKKVNWVESNSMRRKIIKEPGVVISTAGSLQGGPAIEYALHLKKNMKNAIFLVGFQPEETPGRKLLETKHLIVDEYDLDFSEILIKIFDFSAHASHSELVRLAEKTNPQVVFIIHGEEESQKMLAKDIEKIGIKAIIPKFAQKFDLKKVVK